MLRNNNPKKWIFICAFLLASGGFLVPFWPLEILGIIVAAFGGVPFGAIGLGLLLDLAYGAPYGFLHYLFFPFTIGSLVAIGLYQLAMRFLIQRSEQNHL
jgi:hypothetical protein